MKVGNADTALTQSILILRNINMQSIKECVFNGGRKIFKVCFPCKYAMDALNSDLGSIYEMKEKKRDNLTATIKGGCFKVFSCTDRGWI